LIDISNSDPTDYKLFGPGDSAWISAAKQTQPEL